jgi:hypothetical protein
LPWISENAETLHRLFTRVETRRQQGLSVDKALRRRWYGPRFHSAQRVKVRHGQSRLRILYYHWRKSGMTPACLALRFACKLPPVPPETVRAFVGACAVAGVTHFSQAFRLTGSKGFSYRRILAAVPDQVLRAIRGTFKARRQAEILARQQLAQFQGQMHRLLTADASRSRKLKRRSDFVYRASGCREIESIPSGQKTLIQSCSANFNGILKGVSNGLGAEFQGGANHG